MAHPCSLWYPDRTVHIADVHSGITHGQGYRSKFDETAIDLGVNADLIVW